MNLPTMEYILLAMNANVLHITLNRPQVKNALCVEACDEMIAAFDLAAADLSIRAVVIRGAEGNFSAGADLKDLSAARKAPIQDNHDPIAHLNRQFGVLLQKATALPQPLIAVIEGAVMGGGFGLACVSDIAIASVDAKFALPETGLGIPPAQIAPYVVQRVGLTQARRLGVCGARFNGEQALALGMVHFAESDAAAMDQRLATVLQQVRRCAPQANAITKAIMMNLAMPITDKVLDDAAQAFANCVRSAEGAEGTTAFMQKRLPAWAE